MISLFSSLFSSFSFFIIVKSNSGAEIFEKTNALDRFENFASVFGAEFYRLPITQREITLVKKPHKIPDFLSFGDEQLIPMKAGEMITWQLHSL